MPASRGPCSGPCGGMGTQPTGNAALLTWMDLDPGSTGVPGCQPPGPGCFPAWWGLGSGRGRAPGLVPQWRQLVPEAWRWWLLCCLTAIHQWFVVLGCTLTVQDTEPLQPLPRGTQEEEEPPTLPPTGRPGSTPVMESSAPMGLAWRETSGSTQHPGTPGLPLPTRPPCATPTSHAQPGTVWFFK